MVPSGVAGMIGAASESSGTACRMPSSDGGIDTGPGRLSPTAESASRPVPVTASRNASNVIGLSFPVGGKVAPGCDNQPGAISHPWAIPACVPVAAADRAGILMATTLRYGQTTGIGRSPADRRDRRDVPRGLRAGLHDIDLRYRAGRLRLPVRVGADPSVSEPGPDWIAASNISGCRPALRLVIFAEIDAPSSFIAADTVTASAARSASETGPLWRTISCRAPSRWRVLRERILRDDGPLIMACGAGAAGVHPLTYCTMFLPKNVAEWLVEEEHPIEALGYSGCSRAWSRAS